MYVFLICYNEIILYTVHLTFRNICFYMMWHQTSIVYSRVLSKLYWDLVPCTELLLLIRTKMPGYTSIYIHSRTIQNDISSTVLFYCFFFFSVVHITPQCLNCLCVNHCCWQRFTQHVFEHEKYPHSTLAPLNYGSSKVASDCSQ